MRVEADEKATAVAAGVQCPEGRITFTGTIVWADLVQGAAFSYHDDGFTPKMTIRHDDGWTVRVTVPAGTGVLDELKGSRVTLTATLTRSDRDPLMGWGKRPTKVAVTPATL